MKKGIAVLLAVFAGTAFGADVIEMKRNVKFNHKGHQAKLGDCKKCHRKAPGKIEGFSKAAHKNCKGCHISMKKGPTVCKGCHIDIKKGP